MNFLADFFTLELSALATASLGIWLYLLWGRAGYWKADQWLEPAVPPYHWPDVAVVIPARNEAGTIGKTVGSLLGQTYPGRFSVTVVDDGSTDGTARHARDAASNTSEKLHLVEGTPLREGWTGKLWALQQGVDAAARREPNAKYLLFTDADIVYRPGVLQKLVAKAEDRQYTYVSLMAKLDASGFWGKLLIPAFIYFFQMLYPFARTNDASDHLAGGAGGCFLMRRDALEKAGGLSAIRNTVIDDCELADLLKSTRKHLPARIALTHDVVSLRRNDQLATVWNMVARTAFTQLRHSYPMLAGTLAGLALVFVVPAWACVAWIFGAASTGEAMLGFLTWAIMARTYWPTVRLYGLDMVWSATLPFAAIIYGAMTFTSGFRHLRGHGAVWKGRRYPA